MGWVRTLKYYKKRVIRINDSAYSIAAGLAFGVAISFTPAFGTHILQAALFCWIFRANFLAAVLGTTIGNPLTFPFLWSISTAIGVALFNLFGYGEFLSGFEFPTKISELGDLPIKFLIPVMLGGYLVGAITYPLLYYPFRSMVHTAKKIRKNKITRYVHKAAKEVTGQKR